MHLTKIVSAILLTVCSLAFAGTAVAQRQKHRAAPASIREVKDVAASLPAPRACLAAFHDFFSYLQRSNANIVRDEAAQKRWLSKLLREEFKQKLATFTNPGDDPDYPGNGTFIGAWDYPSTYTVAATRHYGARAVIDVLYKWGPNTNYPGDQRTTSFVFLFEDGAWKLDDIYTFRGTYASAESLSQYLREK